MFKTISSFFIILFLISCGSSVFEKNFKYFYDNKLTGLDTLINISGYYHFINEQQYSKNCMFYDDGTFADYVWFKKIKHNNVLKDSLFEIFEWGRYIILNDTIKEQSIHIYGKPDWWALSARDIFEKWFIILNKNTIVEIRRKRFDENSLKDEIVSLRDTAFFVPLSSRPDSSCWLKEKSWAWKNGKIIK